MPRGATKSPGCSMYISALGRTLITEPPRYFHPKTPMHIEQAKGPDILPDCTLKICLDFADFAGNRIAIDAGMIQLLYMACQPFACSIT